MLRCKGSKGKTIFISVKKKKTLVTFFYHVYDIIFEGNDFFFYRSSVNEMRRCIFTAGHVLSQMRGKGMDEKRVT